MPYDDEQDTHECPVPLERPVEDFDPGGMFLSPAGRWEKIVDRSPYSQPAARVNLYTDKTGPGYCWTLWRSTKLPYVPPWVDNRQMFVVINEYGSVIDAAVAESGRARGYGGGHILLTAHLVRGTGWVIADCPDGKTLEYVTLPSKAKARSEVNRRARSHAKRLGLSVWRKPEDGAR